jgi:hypothetical protein
MTFDLGIMLQVATLVTVIAGLACGIMEVRRARRVRVDKGARDVLSIAVNSIILRHATESLSCR